MKFNNVENEQDYKPIKEVRTVGEAINVKEIVQAAFDKKQKDREDRLKHFLKNTGIDRSRVEKDPNLKSEFYKIFDMLDRKDLEEVEKLRGEKDALQKQLDITNAIQSTRDDLAKKIAKNAGIEDDAEIKRIAASLADISKKYEKSQDLG